jgi:hypothetical protein
MTQIFIENQLSSGVLSPSELSTLVQTLQLYAKDINDSPWVEHGYVKPITVGLFPKGYISFPTGAYNLILLDEISLEGALGYHEYEDGGKIPVSYVPVKEIREDDASISEVATHELGEMAVDPYIEPPKTVRHEGKEYIVEIADALQEKPYRVSNDELVANFCWPKWFGLEQTRQNLAQKEIVSVTKPFELAENGYISIKEPGQEWSQIYGSTRDKLPRWASRLKRAGTAKV